MKVIAKKDTFRAARVVACDCGCIGKNAFSIRWQRDDGFNRADDTRHTFGLLVGNENWAGGKKIRTPFLGQSGYGGRPQCRSHAFPQ